MQKITTEPLPQQFQQKISNCIESHDVLYVNQEKDVNFVVIGIEDWKAIEETVFLNKIPNLVESIHQANKEPLEQGTALEDLDW
ncbi:hypothetical protein QUF50_10265 [Thiotrichales bacterium HSG1]|nr:hypothetical protein [Thiotrichales bacterium HSG1]